jgi:hypothetical protein
MGEPALQARLKHLEHLVQVLKSQRREPVDEAREHEELPVEFILSTEKAGLRAEDRRYVDSTNWESIIDDVSSLSCLLTSEMTLTFILRRDHRPHSRPQNV